MKIPKRSLVLLCIALVIVLVGSIVASAFNGSNGVKVSRIAFDTANGKLSGLLYMPKDASESNPKPTIIVTHGYLNSAEMQDANAIELSRRGYVVLALDQRRPIPGTTSLPPPLLTPSSSTPKRSRIIRAASTPFLPMIRCGCGRKSLSAWP